MAVYVKITSGNSTYYYTGSTAASAYSAFQKATGRVGSVTPIDQATFNAGLGKAGYTPSGTPAPPPAAASQPPAAGPPPPTDPVQAFANTFVDSGTQYAQQQLDDYKKLFTTNDPFAYDQAAADRALQTSKDKYDPEFTRKLDEWVSKIGVGLNSFETKNKLIDELSNAKAGIAGQSAQTYQTARENAMQGFSNRGLLSSGVSQTGLGQEQNLRNFQVGSAAQGLLEQNQNFNDLRQNTINQGALSGYRSDIALNKIIPALSTYSTRYGATSSLGTQAADLIKQFQPWASDTGPLSSSSQIPSLSTSVGL